MKYEMQTSCCRQRKPIAVFAQGMRFCEEHKHLAPTRKEFKQYTRTNGKEQFNDWRHRGPNKLELVK